MGEKGGCSENKGLELCYWPSAGVCNCQIPPSVERKVQDCSVLLKSINISYVQVHFVGVTALTQMLVFLHVDRFTDLLI